MNSAPLNILNPIIASIKPIDPQSIVAAQHQLDHLTKPIGSLGQLESIAAQIVAIAAGDLRLPMKRGAYVFAADHGVTDEGVSAYPRQVTAQMVYNFLEGGAAINVLARLHNAELTVVDVGVDAEFIEAPGLRRAKVRNGSRNMHREPAMTDDELAVALAVGIDLALESNAKGEFLLAVGEMGIGNTTAASAIAVMLTKQPSASVTGMGTGLDSAGKIHKQTIIDESIQMHFGGRVPDTSPMNILRAVGGLEIAAMTGFILAAAAHRQAVVCDGFISTAAAALAFAMAPHVRGYLLAGHCSEEPGHRHLLRFIGLSPILGLDMRLGEGTGAVLAMPIIESALRLFTEMATFSSAAVSTANK